MKKMILVLDESGAKGYAKTREKSEGEIGVMAGYAYLESDILNFQDDLDEIVGRYNSSSEKKLHITDLDIERQAALRKDIFEFIRRRKLRWFYQAIYAEGFHQSEFSEERGGERDGKASLHVTLFEKMLIMGLIIASASCRKLNLEIKTDHVDEFIVKKFKQVTDNVLNIFLARPKTYFTKVKDEISNIFKKQYFQTIAKSPDLPHFNHVEYTIHCEYSSLTIMADILANSVYYHLNKSKSEKPGIFLNNKEVLKNHPLVDLAVLAENEEHVPSLVDIVYRRKT
jgi:hypothetical protein